MPYRAVVILVLSATFGLLARAQDIWSAAASGTRENLWGVACGAGRFVAVGEAGTILSSTDGVSWAPRASGTNVWLTAVSYSPEVSRFVAVGDRGVVLFSEDGERWMRGGDVPGAPRVNAVIYGWGRFTALTETGQTFVAEDGAAWLDYTFSFSSLSGPRRLRGLTHTGSGYIATGDQGFVVRWKFAGQEESARIETLGPEFIEGVAAGHGAFVAVAQNGRMWRWETPISAAVALPSPLTRGLNAIVFADTQFVAVGDDGTVLVSHDGVAWQVRKAPVAQSLRAVTASEPHGYVAVGLGGAIVRSAFAIRSPRIVRQPADVTEQSGSTTALSVVASGRGPLGYRWTSGGRPIEGATTATLMLPPLTAVDAGDYAVEVFNAAGSERSRSARVQVFEGTLPARVVDETFVAELDGTVRALQPLPDGSVLVGGEFGFTRPDGRRQHGIARLTATGAFDPTFDVGAGVAGADSPGRVTQLVAQPDGRVLVSGNFSSIAGEPRPGLARLNADGSVDRGFVPAAGGVVELLPDGRVLVANGGPVVRWLNADGSLGQTSSRLAPPGSTFTYAISRTATYADGTVIVAGMVNATYPFGHVARLQPDGSPDPAFQSPGMFLGPNIVELRLLADGRIGIAAHGTGGSRLAMQGGTAAYHLSADGSTRSKVAGTPGALFEQGAVLFIPDGRTVVASAVRQPFAPQVERPVPNSLLRYHGDGTVDDSFLLGPGVNDNVRALARGPDGRIWVGGEFTNVAGVPRVRLARLNETGLNPNRPQILAVEPRYQEVATGQTITLRTRAVGTEPLRISWTQHYEGGLFLNPFFRDSRTDVLTIPNADHRFTGYYQVRASTPAGAIESDYVYVKVVPAGPPVIARAPIADEVRVGRPLTLSVELADFTGSTYQWHFNDAPVPHATSNVFQIDAATLDQAGRYSVVATNRHGSVRASADVQVVAAPVLANVSTRAWTGDGESALILGFVYAGTLPRWGKSFVVRGVGPTLASFGVTSPLEDPRFTMLAADGSIVIENDNWRDAAGASSILQRGFELPWYSRDAAANAYAPAPGAYTVHITGAGGGSGVALGEVYEESRRGRLINLSARVFVGTGDAQAIPGFVLEGSGRVRLLIRAVGPGLQPFGVEAALANPTLTVVDKDGRVLATNDNWNAQPNAAELAAVSARIGAFALAQGSADAAVLLELPAGSYTALVSGVGGGTGIALVEVYEVP